MNYLLKKFLFSLNPELAHALALTSLQWIYRLRASHLIRNDWHNPCKVMNLEFKNPVGLAAGFDKNGEYVDALSALGFGFIEIGTVTPQPQAGNPRPRLFRLDDDQAIINRMGFNNKGMAYVIHQLKRTQYQGILGVNIGKNKSTEIEKADLDYIQLFRAFWPYASYIVINVSSPNTPGLRELQDPTVLSELLAKLKNEQAAVASQKYVPLVVKLSPDLSQSQLHDIATILLKSEIDGVIATNTTVKRENLRTTLFANEKGGLSGKPLASLSNDVIKILRGQLMDQIPIFGCGGIMDASSARDKFEAGASLIQIYSGFVFQGTRILKQLQLSLKN